MGLANIAGAFSYSFPVSASTSRTAVNNATGGTVYYTSACVMQAPQKQRGIRALQKHGCEWLLTCCVRCAGARTCMSALISSFIAFLSLLFLYGQAHGRRGLGFLYGQAPGRRGSGPPIGLGRLRDNALPCDPLLAGAQAWCAHHAQPQHATHGARAIHSLLRHAHKYAPLWSNRLLLLPALLRCMYVVEQGVSTSCPTARSPQSSSPRSATYATASIYPSLPPCLTSKPRLHAHSMHTQVYNLINFSEFMRVYRSGAYSDLCAMLTTFIFSLALGVKVRHSAG